MKHGMWLYMVGVSGYFYTKPIFVGPHDSKPMHSAVIMLFLWKIKNVQWFIHFFYTRLYRSNSKKRVLSYEYKLVKLELLVHLVAIHLNKPQFLWAWMQQTCILILIVFFMGIKECHISLIHE